MVIIIKNRKAIDSWSTGTWPFVSVELADAGVCEVEVELLSTRVWFRRDAVSKLLLSSTDWVLPWL